MSVVLPSLLLLLRLLWSRRLTTRLNRHYLSRPHTREKVVVKHCKNIRHDPYIRFTINRLLEDKVL
jgi:hypothetical protein